MKIVLIFSIILSAAVFQFCNSPAEKQTEEKPQAAIAVASTGPDAIIYKTKADYNALVPVIMNEEKTEIVSFPAPGDLKYKGKPAVPGLLAKGFLLDNRGITANVAFLSITYEDYMALPETPSVDELMHMVIDKDPLIEMYSCGKRQQYHNEVDDLNALINEDDFEEFTRLK